MKNTFLRITENKRLPAKLSMGAVVLICISVISAERCISSVDFSATPAAGALSYDWWKRADGEARAVAADSSVIAIRQGWVSGVAKSTAITNGIVSDPRLLSLIAQALPKMDPPHFSKPSKFYVASINGFYAKHKSQRSWGIASVLLCFADEPDPTCP